MAIPIGLIASFAIKVLPNIRRLSYVLASKGLRTTMKRKLFVLGAYSKRIITPSKSLKTIKRIKRKYNLNSFQQIKQRLADAANDIRAKGSVLGGKGKTVDSFKRLVAEGLSRPSKKSLLFDTATDLAGLTYGVSALAGKEHVVDKLERKAQELNQKRKQLTEKQFPTHREPPSSASTGGVVVVRGHMRDGVWIATYTRSS